jgi:hypothetical protein
MLQLREGLQTRGMRKLETRLKQNHLAHLEPTLAGNKRSELWKGLQQIIKSYRELRDHFPLQVEKRSVAEEKAVEYAESLMLRTANI